MKTEVKKKIVAFIILTVLAIILTAVIIWQNNKDKVIATKLSQKADISMEADKLNRNGRVYRRKSYVKAILVLGIDSSVDMHYVQDAGSGGQADSVGLIAWDTERDKLSMIIIPRDTMTYIPVTDVGGEIIGNTLQHITMAFSFGDGNEISADFMKESVSNLFDGLHIDRYFAMNTMAIEKVNDAVGGVDVTVPYDGMEKADASFIKGNTVTLNGEKAEKFLRFRDTNKDFSAVTRIEAHKEYLRAYQMKLKQFKGDSIVEKILSDIEPYCYSDMQKDMILKLGACAMTDDGFNANRIYVLEGENKKTELYDEFYADHDKAMDKIIELFYTEE